jgi:hypothetical protein
MSLLDGFNKAVKHLDISKVSKDTTTAPHKRDTIQKVREVRKLSVEINIVDAIFGFEAEFVTNNIPLVGRIKLNIDTPFRISNYKRFFVRNTNIETQPQMPLDLDTASAPYHQVGSIIVVRCVHEGQVLRFKLGPNKSNLLDGIYYDRGVEVPSDQIYGYYRCAVNAPFYEGEKLYPPVYLECYKGFVLTQGNPPRYGIKTMRVQTSKLHNPSTLEEAMSESTYTAIPRSSISLTFPHTFGTSFPEI